VAEIPDLGSDLERAFDTQLIRLAPDLPPPVSGYAFAVEPQDYHPEAAALFGKRRWKFDRAWPNQKIAVELEGGRYGRTITCQNCGQLVRATRGDGTAGKPIRVLGWHARDERFQADIEKYNAAQILGWIVLRFTREDVEGMPFDMISAIRMAFTMRLPGPAVVEPITRQQREVLRLVAGGWFPAEVAQKMNLSVRTVRRHLEEASQKLCTRNRSATVGRALAWGMIRPDEIIWAEVVDCTRQDPETD